MESRYIGLRFGMLTVISIADAKTYKKGDHYRKLARYNVLCDCGNTTVVFGQDLRSGKTRSCNQDLCRLHYVDRYMPAFNAVVKGYKDSASKRGYIFDLTHNDVFRITKEACYYCGIVESQTRRIKSGKYMSEYSYNGIDRVNNSLGYTLNNVVACCGACNVAKNNMSQSDFINLCKRIAKRHYITLLAIAL
jgi:5-methylcytosine-specific restriction endonuclease McrA